MGDRRFEAEADLEQALLEYFRSKDVPEDELVELVQMAFDCIEAC